MQIEASTPHTMSEAPDQEVVTGPGGGALVILAGVAVVVLVVLGVRTWRRRRDSWSDDT